MAQVEEKECPAEVDAIGIRIPVQRAVLVEEKEEVGVVEKIDKDARGKLDGVTMEELVKITRVLTQAVNTGRAGLIAALRVFCKAGDIKAYGMQIKTLQEWKKEGIARKGKKQQGGKID